MKNPKRTGPILDEEIQGLFKPILISRSLKADSEVYKFARDTKADIQAFNQAIREKTVYGLLSSTDQFLHRGFGTLHLSEIFLSRSANGNIQLMTKCKCRCGNYLTVPLREVINGNVMSCGCITPIPKSVLKSTTVYQSQSVNNWSTTVDGIQWLGKRYTWFVSFLDNPKNPLMRYVETAEEALAIRRAAEVDYYGSSPIDQYYDLMLKELKQIERIYLQKHPPKVQGISYQKTTGKWVARLSNENKIVFNQSFPTREEAVQARYDAEIKTYGQPLMPKKYYFER